MIIFSLRRGRGQGGRNALGRGPLPPAIFICGRIPLAVFSPAGGRARGGGRGGGFWTLGSEEAQGLRRDGFPVRTVGRPAWWPIGVCARSHFCLRVKHAAWRGVAHVRFLPLSF